MKTIRKREIKKVSIISKIISFMKKYYFLIIIIGCIGFVGVVLFVKLYVQKPNYIYARIKVGQGYWWANNTQRVSLWYIRAIQKATEEKDITGKTTAKILRVEYYPYYGSSQFDTYVTVKLRVSKGASNGTYNFKRETIGVSSPINLEFPTVQFSGTILALDEKPLAENSVKRTFYLTKKYAFPWEYDQIKIGDYFADGNGKIIEILEKAKGDTNQFYINETGKFVNTESETYQYIFLKVQVRLKKEGEQLYYGEEINIAPGRSFGFVTNASTYNDYFIEKLE